MITDESPPVAAPAPSPARDRFVLAGLLAVFLISGASGLIYQVVWVRMLVLTFGVTAYAVSAVLTSFFAGLALGSFLAGRFADRLLAPLRAYAAAEILIAVAGLLTPAVFALTRAVYVATYDRLPDGSPWALTLLRLALALVALIVPTTLMGATLPLIVRSSLARGAGPSRNISLLYAANTFGAAAGTFLAGFELIGRYGLRGTLLAAAAGNLAAAAGALALGRAAVASAGAASDEAGASSATSPSQMTTRPQGHAGGSGPDGEEAVGHPAEPAAPVRVARVTLAVFGVSGAVSLAYEVVWTRMLAVYFDATIYGFTAMLTMVLLGIGAGSWLVGLVIGRRWRWPLIFAGIEAGVGLFGLLTLSLLPRIIPLADRLGLYADPGPLGQFSLRFMAFAAFLVVFPPMVLLGASFPVAVRVVGAGGTVGRRVGGVYAVNVLGGIAGALLGGFVLLPVLGARSSLLLLACANLALAVALVWAAGGARRTLPFALAAGAVALAGVVLAPNVLDGVFRERFAGQRVVFVDEGLENTVVVADTPATGERKLYINGQPQASTAGFVADFQRLIGHLPMLLHPSPKRALVIGLGGGAAAGALASHSETAVDVVELSSAIVRAAPLFDAVNGGVLGRPNVRLRVDDGRNWLLRGRQYDVITADVIRPGHAGAGAVYSREYFELARDALPEDGMMLQWFEQLSEEQYKLMLRAFVETFPYVTLWANGSLAVGTRQPLVIDRATLAERLAGPSARPSLAAIGLNTPDDVLALYTGDREEALRYLGDERRAVTDDRPYIEFRRSLSGDRRPPDLRGFSRDPRPLLKPE